MINKLIIVLLKKKDQINHTITIFLNIMNVIMIYEIGIYYIIFRVIGFCYSLYTG